MKAQLRKRFAGDADIRIALVVAKQDVVARLVRLDQVVLEQQRLALRARDRRLDARDLRDHHRGARMMIGLLEVARHALLQVARLADVQRLAGGVEHAIDARAVGQRGERARARRRRRSFGIAAAQRARRRPVVARRRARGLQVLRRCARTPPRTSPSSVVACWCCSGCSDSCRTGAALRGSACSAPCANGYSRAREPSARSVASCAIRPSASTALPTGSCASSAAR